MIKDCETATVKLTELNPAAYNPRKISDDAISGLDESIGKFGLITPIIWNKRSGNIVGGHQRYQVIRTRGYKETEVVVVDLDDDNEIALNIALNSSMSKGTYTEDVIVLLQQARVDLGSVFDNLNLDLMLEKM